MAPSENAHLTTTGRATADNFAHPIEDRYFNDYVPGAGHVVGSRTIASGWHTPAVMMPLYADQCLSKVASLASLGVDEVHRRRPVRPDLSVQATVRAARPSRSNPDRGLVPPGCRGGHVTS